MPHFELYILCKVSLTIIILNEALLLSKKKRFVSFLLSAELRFVYYSLTVKADGLLFSLYSACLHLIPSYKSLNGCCFLLSLAIACYSLLDFFGCALSLGCVISLESRSTRRV